MELKDYISESLIQICEGIRIAKAQIGCVPLNRSSDYKKMYIIAPDDVRDHNDVINFEIALTVSNNNAADIKGGGKSGNVLQVLGISVGLEGKAQQQCSHENIQRLSFSVHYLPNYLEPLENTQEK